MADPIFKELAYSTLAQTASNPNRDFLRATPRNPVLGYLSDLAASSYAPQRTQQMQGVAQFFGAPAISQTLDRLSYGEPLTTGAGGIGGTTRFRPEVIEAAMSVAPFVSPAARMTKGLPVGMSIKDVGQQAPAKAIRRFDDGGLEVGYGRGDSKILVTVAPTGKNDRMLSASLENIGGYPTGTGDATMAYVDALESVIKDARGRTVYWDGFTSESVQSDKARAIYDRLKAAGIPFEKNVFEGRSKNALSLTQEQLLNIDFDQVRNNLIKSAAKKEYQAPKPPAQDRQGISETQQRARIMSDIGQDPYTIYQQTGVWLGGNE